MNKKLILRLYKLFLKTLQAILYIISTPKLQLIKVLFLYILIFFNYIFSIAKAIYSRSRIF